jgi:predicted nucleic-acid-binding Zn-ribbon protein
MGTKRRNQHEGGELKCTMAEKELVLDVKELHVVSVTCVKCRYGTIYDLEQVKPMPEAARSVTYYLKFECNCGESAANDVDKMLTSLWSAYQSLKSLNNQRIEFRTRLNTTQLTTF